MRSLLYVFLICIALPAQAASFNINFYDSTNTRVGSGAFDIAFGKTICVFDPGVDECVDKKNPVFNFSAYVNGMIWEQQPEPEPESAVELWWSAPGQEPGIGMHGMIGGISEGIWDFGNPVAESFGMVFFQSTWHSGKGAWQQYNIDGFGAPFNDRGSWTAALVPLPAALWLFLSGLISLGFYRKGANRPR